jgi:hypothetical protein
MYGTENNAYSEAPYAVTCSFHQRIRRGWGKTTTVIADVATTSPIEGFSLMSPPVSLPHTSQLSIERGGLETHNISKKSTKARHDTISPPRSMMGSAKDVKESGEALLG